MTNRLVDLSLPPPPCFSMSTVNVSELVSNANKRVSDSTSPVEKETVAPEASSNGGPRTLLTYEVKPWDSETILDELAVELKATTFPGLVQWQEKHELVDIAFGIQKLRISLTIEEDNSSLDSIQEHILADGREDKIQSVDLVNASEVAPEAKKTTTESNPVAKNNAAESNPVAKDNAAEPVETKVDIPPPQAKAASPPPNVSYTSIVEREHTFAELYCTYGSVSNYITFFIMCLGIVLYASLPKGTPGIPYVLSFGLFGFAGGFTNWLAVKMLFDKIPFLYGSGVIPRQFKEIRETVKTTIMATFFDQQYLGTYLNDRSKDLLAKIDVKDRIQKIVDDPETEGLIADELSKLATTPEGAFLAMVPMMMPGMTMRTIAAMMKKPLGGFATKMAEKLTTSFDITEFVSVDNVRQEIDALMTEKLAELTPPIVKKLMEDVIREHLGWLIVWGNVFGGLLGIISQLAGYGV